MDLSCYVFVAIIAVVYKALFPSHVPWPESKKGTQEKKRNNKKETESRKSKKTKKNERNELSIWTAIVSPKVPKDDKLVRQLSALSYCHSSFYNIKVSKESPVRLPSELNP